MKKSAQKALLCILTVLFLLTPLNTGFAQETPQLSIRAEPEEGDSEVYANHKFTLYVSGCPTGSNVFVTDSRNESRVGGIEDNEGPDAGKMSNEVDTSGRQENDEGEADAEERGWDVLTVGEESKEYTYTQGGSYTVTATCCRLPIAAGGTFTCSPDLNSAATFSLPIKDPGEVQSEGLAANACEVCHPDWPVYEGQLPEGERCRGGVKTDDKYKYFLKPVRTDSCPEKYVCNHVIGCAQPTLGLTPPPIPCVRGYKYVIPEGADPETAVATPVETTNPLEIEKCLEFDTAISGIRLDPAEFITSILGILLSISGMVALYLIIRSGYQLMTSQGNPEAIQAARERLTSAIVGLLLIIFSLVIVQIIGVDILKLPGFGTQ